MLAYPGSILGRLLVELGEACAGGLPCVDERRSNSGDSTVFRPGNVISLCVGDFSGVCRGTAGHVVVVGLGERTASDARGRLSWESSIRAHAAREGPRLRYRQSVRLGGKDINICVLLRSLPACRGKREAETEDAEEEGGFEAVIG